ncbi:MAG TPA: alpha/beta hydrolase family protein [Candidatus Sumerlaeota bacterium]|nr:alpha/beta hydrolase family protein [Candidatus Sumerlaeota bacterium]HPK02469.1 alpha/beta hydrolase family protein [Candidatus Sumerlaeota bacterium]
MSPTSPGSGPSSPADPARFRTYPRLSRLWKQSTRRLGLDATTRAELAAWRRRLRRHLRRLTGYDRLAPAPLAPRLTEEVACDGYRRQRVEIQVEPGLFMPLYVLIPAGSAGPWPPVMALHGHGSGGKYAVAGRRDLPDLDETIRIHNYDYGVQLVREGFIVFCPDARGFGERQEARVEGGLLVSSCLAINQMALPLGRTVTGMWAWDVHRLVDYILTRGDCRAAPLGCMGLSGGGLQTLWAAALDDRIGYSVVSGYFYGYREALFDVYVHCSCNYVPGLFEAIDMGDLGALIAPRPLCIETGARDPLNGAGGLKNVRSQVRIARQAYRMLGASRALTHAVFDGPHRWDGTEAIPWMKRAAGL